VAINLPETYKNRKDVGLVSLSMAVSLATTVDINYRRFVLEDCTVKN
jgi:hypothetical protein